MLRNRKALGACCLVLIIGVSGVSPEASALSSAFNFSGQPVPDDDSGILPSVSATFTWDDLCLSSCVLRIDLDYNDSNGGAGLISNAQGLTGVVWDMTGGATLLDNLLQIGAEVVSPTLVGAQSATANADLADITVDGVSGQQTTAHWGVRNDLSTLSGTIGTNILSSVGDVTVGNAVGVDFMGVDHLLPGGTVSSVESNPPNGIPFAIVDPFTTVLVGEAGDVALAQSSTAAFLLYDGALTDIENVQPMFGTDGVVIPEPGTAMLLGAGLLGLAGFRRR